MRKRQRFYIALAFLAPALLLFTAFVAIPTLNAFRFSLWKWDGLGQPQWAGLHNFSLMFSDREIFLKALVNNLILMFVPSVGILVLSLFFASLLSRGIRGSNVFRVAFFFPNVIPGVAVAILWMLLYSTNSFGLINHLLAFYGVKEPVPFTASKYLIWAICPLTVWTAMGFYMVLFFSAMQEVPETLYEAAELDGAGRWSTFWHVTLPMTWDVVVIGLVFLVIGGITAFEKIWVMEHQTPNPESHVFGTLMFQKIFTEYNIGYGSTVAVLIFVMVMAGTLLTLKLSRKESLD